MNSRGSRILGVLGGMGPAATVDFYAKLVRLTPAKRDQDHVRVVIWADPTIPSRQMAILDGGDDLAPSLRQGIDNLVRCGAEIIVAPCNTVHAVLPAIVAQYPVEFINIVTATLDMLQETAASLTSSVGLMATDAALAAGLYQRALDERGLKVTTLTAGSQRSLMDVVAAVKAGSTSDEVSAQVEHLLEELKNSGATAAIAACTELSTVIEQCTHPAGMVVIDPAIALASAAISRAIDLR